MRNVKFILIIIAALTLFLSSCDKENDLVSSEENFEAETTAYVDLLNAFDLSDAEEATDGYKWGDIGCMTVTIHDNGTEEFWPRSWTLDYGEEGCEGRYHNVRKGKIHISLTDDWKNESSLRTITFEDYYFNENKIEGVKTIFNNGLNEAENPVFTRKVEDGIYTKSTGETMTRNSTRVCEFIEGSETFSREDDKWSVTGSGEGINFDEESFTVNITTALIYQHRCFLPISGVVEIVINEADTIVVDYGEGECDTIITVTKNGETIEIDLSV